MPTNHHPALASTDNVKMIHLQCFYGRSSTGCAAKHVCPILTPAEMPRPTLAAWMKQRYPPVRFEVVCMGEIPFTSITPTTRQTQVVGFRDTALRPRHDVVYRHGYTSLCGRTQAILTAMSGSLSYKSSQSRRQPCHLWPPPMFLPFHYPRQTVSALLQECIGCSLQGGESLSGL